jgi:hypothetical protein
MFPLSEDMFMPGDAFVQMNCKIFDIFCMRQSFIVDVDYGIGFSAISESDMG